MGISNACILCLQENKQKPFDIYYDPAVSDVLKCRPVLDSFKLRIRELLAEWEGHPTLIELMTVIDRIMSFPVTSPLIKFVTGLEVLIHKAQEWESNAAKHVSLQDHMNNVSQLIIDWRKLELANWRSCLDTVQYQCSSKASKWWFFIYGLVEGYLNPQSTEVSEHTLAVILLSGFTTITVSVYIIVKADASLHLKSFTGLPSIQRIYISGI